MGRRGVLLFYITFVYPYMEKVGWIKANHHIAGFVLSKKCLVDLRKIFASLKEKKIVLRLFLYGEVSVVYFIF